MAITKIFKNGNSQAVRIPAELAYNAWDIELTIEREGVAKPVCVAQSLSRSYP